MAGAITQIRETLHDLRDFRIQRSIVFPIVLLLLFMGAGLLLAGYLINRSVFHTVFEERERNKAQNTHRAINSLVSQEATRISGLARILRSDTDIVYGLFYYKESQNNTRPLKLTMDKLYPEMNLSFFVTADIRGNVLCRAGSSANREPEDLTKTQAFKNALNEEQIVAIISDDGTASIVAITPVYFFGQAKPSGILILGVRIDDAFAARIAKETNSQTFIATSTKVIAGSYDLSSTNSFDPELAQESLQQQKPFFQINRKALRSYTYIPLTIVDKNFCLLIESDISVIQELLSKNLTRTLQWGLALMVCIALLGVGLAFLIIYPINGLYRKALDTIQEYSGGSDLDLPLTGNEITTLVRANDIMLETIKNHLAERTQAEEAFSETSGVLHALIEASPLAVIVGEIDWTVRVWNQEAARMFGWSASEVIGRVNPILALEGARELQELYDLVLKGEKYSNKEIRCAGRHGNELYLAFSGAPLLDAQGKVFSLVMILADITDNRKAEEALRRSEERLARSIKMEAVGKLAGSVASDFNNLLSVITGYGELLLVQTSEDSPVRKEVEEICKAGEQALLLTHQLLAFSRRQILNPRLLRLDEVLESLGKTLLQIVGENIELTTIVGVGAWTVQVDPTQIERVFMNLCVNARDAMPSGGKLMLKTENITLEAPITERELTIPPGRYATLSVTDDGVGMDEETLSRIFEPFFYTETQGDRTGLGLATVYGIVKQSNGYIRVTSAPGEGTTFTVYFPAADNVAEDEAR